MLISGPIMTMSRAGCKRNRRVRHQQIFPHGGDPTVLVEPCGGSRANVYLFIRALAEALFCSFDRRFSLPLVLSVTENQNVQQAK
jgi:hypothetical protein